MSYLNELWVPDPNKNELFKIVNDALDSKYASDDYPSAVCVDINQIDVWVVFSKGNKVGQFRDGTFVKYINVGKTPMGIAQGPDGAIYVTNYSSGTITKIVNGVVVMNISVGIGPRGVCVTPDGAVWVSNYISNTVSKIVNDVKVKDIAVGLNPYGICGDKANNVYVACSTSNIVTKITGITKVLDIKVGKVPYGVCVDPSGDVWVSNFYAGTVQEIKNGVAGDPIIVGSGPFAIAATKDAIFVCNFLSGDISKIYGGKVVETIAVCTNPHGFGDFTGYQAYLLFKDNSGGGTSGKVAFDDLSTDLQDMIKNGSLALPIADADVKHDHPTYKTVKAAIDHLLYVEPGITAFTNTVGTVEMGTTVNAVTLNWVLNKPMARQTINNGVGDVPVGTVTKALTGLNITADTTWALTVTDTEGTAITKSTAVSFRNKRYWGASANAALAAGDIISALNGEFASDYKMSKTLDATGGKYIYFAVPSSFALTDAKFKVGGLSNSDWAKTTVAFTNANGYTTNYDIFRSTYVQTGAAILVDIA